MSELIEYIDKFEYVILYRMYCSGHVAEVPSAICGKPVREVADHIFSDEPSVMYPSSSIRRAIPSDGLWVPYEGNPEEFRKTGPDALCGRNLAEVLLPEGIISVGNYAFYGCDNLKAVTFPGSLTRIGSGLFYSCQRMRRLTFIAPGSMKGGTDDFTPPLLQEVLEAINQEVEVVVRQRSGKELYRLLFPEFYEEPKENTPARVIQVIWHGSGYQYRQCFMSRKLEFHKYDEILPAAIPQETPETLIRLCLGRLKTPVHLSASGKEVYLSCLKDMTADLWDFISSDQETDLCEWLEVLDHAGFYTSDLIDLYIEKASGLRRGDASAYLMDLRHRKFSPARKNKYEF